MFPRQVLYQPSHLQPGFDYMLMRALIWVYTQMFACYVFMPEKEGGEREEPSLHLLVMMASHDPTW